MRGVLIGVVLSTAALSAQPAERIIDLSTFGWGAVTADPINTDGDDTTQEWLVTEALQARPRVRVVTERPFCASDWFVPVPSVDTPAPVEVRTIAGRSHWFWPATARFVVEPTGRYIVTTPLIHRAIETPVCVPE